MEEQRRSNSKSLLVVLLVVLNLVLLGAVAWLQFKDDDEAVTTETNQALTETQNDREDLVATNTVTASGKGAFTVVFPDGWTNILRASDDDFFWVGGQAQPEVRRGTAPQFKDVNGFGTDSISVFSIAVGDNFADPQGTATDFSVGKDGLKGKKYIYEYPEDTDAYGIGYLRLKGDRDYEYIFDIGDGKQLRASYHVYGVDPRNNIETVDAIVDSIRLN